MCGVGNDDTMKLILCAMLIMLMLLMNMWLLMIMMIMRVWLMCMCGVIICVLVYVVTCVGAYYDDNDDCVCDINATDDVDVCVDCGVHY